MGTFSTFDIFGNPLVPAPAAGAVSRPTADYRAFWDNALSSFLNYLKGHGRAENTRETYRKAIVRLFTWIDANEIPLSGITEDVLVEYRESLKALSSSSGNTNVVALRRFFHWLESHGCYDDVARNIEGFVSKKGFKKMPLTIQEQQRLLDYMQDRQDVPELIRLRDYAIVNTFLLCGLRSVEVSRARICDVTTKYGQDVLMVWGKGHDRPDTPVVLTAEAMEPIRTYLEARGAAAPDAPLFECEGRGSKGDAMSTRRIQDIVKQSLRAIGLDAHEYSTHSLRHSTGTTLLELGASLSDVQHVLRHKDEKVTHIYVEMKHEELMIKNSPQHLLDNVFNRK